MEMPRVLLSICLYSAVAMGQFGNFETELASYYSKSILGS